MSFCRCALLCMPTGSTSSTAPECETRSGNAGTFGSKLFSLDAPSTQLLRTIGPQL